MDYPEPALLVLYSGNHFFRPDGEGHRLALNGHAGAAGYDARLPAHQQPDRKVPSRHHRAHARLVPRPHGAFWRRILVTKTQFDAWFPPGLKVTADTPHNVARRIYELSIRHLPIYALNLHARDVAAKKPREAGEVYESFKRFYTVAELDSQQLWQRLDAKLAQLGGPQKVAELFAEAQRKHREGITAAGAK